jgi:membrane protein DedA with SNARE-associated domain
MIEAILHAFEHYAANYGYAILFLVTLLENSIFLGAFMPGETFAFLSGFYASLGILNPYLLVVVIVVGSVMGDNLGFLLGRKKGKRWLINIGKYFGYREEKIDRAEDFWKDHGGKSIFLGRFIAVARTFVPFLSGASKIKYKTFFVYDLAGAIIWAIVHVSIGYFFGTNFRIIKNVFGGVGFVLLIVFVFVIYRYLVRKGIEKVEEE